MCLFFFVEAPEPEFDRRSLYDRLKEQKDKKQYEEDEDKKFSNFLWKRSYTFLSYYVRASVYVSLCFFRTYGTRFRQRRGGLLGFRR